MSLELEIKLLREEISGLRAFLSTLSQNTGPTPENPLVADLNGSNDDTQVEVEAAAAPEPKKAEKTKKKKAEKVVEPVEAVGDDTPAPTAEDLQALCLELVKADRSKKNKIYEVISSFGGKTIGQVDSSKYAELGVALEALR